MAINAEAFGAGDDIQTVNKTAWLRGAWVCPKPLHWRTRVLARLAAICGIAIAAAVATAIAGSSTQVLLLSPLGLVVFVIAVAAAAWVAAAAKAWLDVLTRSFDDCPEPQLITAANGTVVQANPAFLRLFTESEKTPLDRIERAAASPEAAAAFRSLRRQATASASAVANLSLRLAGGGRERDFQISAQPGAGRAGYQLWRLRELGASRVPPPIADGTGLAGSEILDQARDRPYSTDDNRRAPAGDRSMAPRPGGNAAELVESGADLCRLTPAPSGAGRDSVQPFFGDAPVGIGVVDHRGCFTQANRALGELFDAGPETLIGRGLIALLNPAARAAVAARLADAAIGREDRTPIEIRLAPPGERTMVLLLSRFGKSVDDDRSGAATPIRAEGEPGPTEDAATPAGAAPAGVAPGQGLTLYFIDVTEQKHLEIQFAQAQKMQAIGQLAGGVAHDFNNLLTAMIGFCDLLLLRSRPGDPAFADIMQIKQNANRAANLVRQLLAFSRQQSLQPRVLDITDVLAELSHLLQRLIGENIELKFIHGRDLGLVKVDQGQLEQVVINLAVNARDAMLAGGRLTIRTQKSHQPRPVRRGTELMPVGDYVLIEVADTGIGIAPDILARIFEPFFSTKEVGSGTGLGLSTVYGIVKQTGGFVFVDSCPGHGTVFSIYLPRHLAADAVQREVGEAEPVLARDLTGSGTIVLVEDDDAVRMFGARALRNKGYRVLEAKSGESALTMIRNAADPIDLVITDVVMPQMDGPALVRELREFDCDIKVIFISGYAEDAFRQRLDQEREIHFLPKPFNLKQLALTVKEVLGSDFGFP